MALRAQKTGMRISIDFHYSDSWADLGKQFKPKACENHSFSELLTNIYDRTFDVLNALKKVGVSPEWAQVGNKITGEKL